MQSNYRKWTLLGLGWQVVGMWEILEMIRRKHSHSGICTLLIGSFWGSYFGAGVPELGASLPAQFIDHGCCLGEFREFQEWNNHLGLSETH